MFGRKHLQAFNQDEQPPQKPQLAIVAIAIIFDRSTQAYGKRMQKHMEATHG